MKNKDYKCTLTEEILQNLGFVNSGKERHTERTIWRLRLPYYHYQIQVVLTDLPAHNPNCGILSLYRQKEKVKGFKQSGKFGVKEVWHEFPERCFAVAHHVHTPERLRQIIASLTYVAV